LRTAELGAWPREEDGRPEKLIRIFAYESLPLGVARSTKQRLGVGDEFDTLGKVLWGRLDQTTDTMWVRFDHLVATKKADRVMVEMRWVTFAEFEARFPRSQMPFKMAAAIFNNQTPTRINPHRDEDDHEDMFLAKNPLDRLDEDDELDWSQQPKVLDETGAKLWWQEKFGGGN
jgi:hypothetical protein